MNRALRFDRLEIRDVYPLTPEGYLDVDAYLARDGLLRYSDGIKTWMEYRPRAELEAAADSWAHAPITDDHPPVMVDSSNAAQYRRGTVISTPTVVDADGVAYLAAKIRIDDAALVAKICNGQRELSIGFMADVAPEAGEVNGIRYDAVQRSLAGNHVASVQRGRAGPAVRVLLDSAQNPIPVCYDAGVKPNHEVPRMKKITLPAGIKMDKLKAWVAHTIANPPEQHKRGDEVGLPTTMAKLVGPDGTEIEVPTWVAALVAEALDAHKAANAPATSPDAPADPMAEAENAPAPKPEDDPMAEPDKNKPKPAPMTPDAVQALVRKRGRLERLAASAGVAEAKIDGADDVALAREYVSTVLPHAKAQAEKADGAALDALVELAASTPRAENENPFEVPRAIGDAAADDPIVLAYAQSMVANGTH